MKKFAVTLLGVAFLPLLVVSCSGGSGGAQAEDTPEMAAFEFRHESWLVPEVYRLLEARDLRRLVAQGPGRRRSAAAG